MVKYYSRHQTVPAQRIFGEVIEQMQDSPKSGGIQMKHKIFTRNKLAIFSAIAGILALGLGISTKQKRASAISIIGGADGPTSVFIAGKAGSFFWPLFTLGVCLLGLAVILYLSVKRKGKKR